MRKTFASFTLVAALGLGAAALPGCNSAWWQNITSNPVEAVQEFEAGINVAVSAAQLAWPAILQAIPAANQAQAQQQFTNALSSVNHAMQLLNDGVNAAVAAQTSNPNFTALMQAVSDAVAQVVAIVDTYTGTQPAPAPTPAVDAGPAVAAVVYSPKVPTAVGNVTDMHAAYSSLSRWGVTLK